MYKKTGLATSPFQKQVAWNEIFLRFFAVVSWRLIYVWQKVMPFCCLIQDYWQMSRVHLETEADC